VVLNQVAEELLKLGHEARSICYLSLDDNLLKLMPLREILDLYREAINPEGERAFLLLDEVHYAAGWAQEIKTLVDHHPEYRVLATGSSSLDARMEGTHAGVGRWITIPIPTLSFYEFLHIRGEATPEVPEVRIMAMRDWKPEQFVPLALAMRPAMPLFHRYLLVGGFPETAQQRDVATCQKLLREDVVDRVLKRDITSLFNVRSVNELEKLFLYVCLHSGGQINVQTCAQQLGMPRTTVSNHLELLVQANLLYKLGPDERAGKKALKARYKYYLVDAALRNAVLLSGEDILHDPAEMGLIVETAVLRHLFASYYRETPTFSYWSDTRRQREVDLVMRIPRYVVPVEVKYRGDARLSAESGLAQFVQEVRDTRPIVITQRDSDFAAEPLPGSDVRALRIPAHIFCYLIGASERHSAGA
jgi:uncharacterized protein